MPQVHIIGGGIIGCAIAWRLAQSGAQVIISEAGRLGGQSSGAGAGMLAPGGEVDHDSTWARHTVEGLAMYPAFVGELSEESGVAIDYRSCGALELAYSAYELHDITRKAEFQAALGIPSTPVTPAEAAAMAPALAVDGLHGARHYPNDAIVDPRNIMQALEKALRARGVEIREQSPVTKLPEADAVVLAAGAWSSSIVSGAPESFPVKGYLVGYQFNHGTLKPILRHGHTYILQRSNGFTIVGSTTERAGFDTKIDPAIVQRLHERANRYLPSLFRSSPDVSWIGFRPGVEGGTPQVRRMEGTNIMLAYGHYRNGILLAPLTATMVRNEVLSNFTHQG